jgi:hypothetical protein
MDRVETLLEKLKEQITQQCHIDELLLTAQMIQSELLHLKSQDNQNNSPNNIAIHISGNTEKKTTESIEFISLNINEEDVLAELEQIKEAADAKNKSSIKNKPQIKIDTKEPIVPIVPIEIKSTPPPVVELPIIKEAPPIVVEEKLVVPLKEEENASLNESLKYNQNTELTEMLSNEPIKDLKKAIGINDRFLFINELFNGDEVMFERSIKTINSFSIYPEAEYWIRRELKLKLAWDEKNPIVKQFDQLCKRRFSAI